MQDLVDTTQFYAPPELRSGSRLTLPGEEARHAFAVLRLRAGAQIVVVDGAGGWYRVELDRLSKNEGGGRIVEERRDVGEVPYRLSLAVGLQRHAKRFEILLEKATELGVDELIPLQTERTLRTTFRPDRSHKIVVAAMKQCRRSRLLKLGAPCTLEETLEPSHALFVCHERVDGLSLLEALNTHEHPEHVRVYIGPEGGFSEREVEQVVACGGDVVSLGPLRLRTETAATAAAAALLQSYIAR